MTDQMSIGVRRERLPLPHVPEDTTYFAAGPITFGVGFRQLRQETVHRARALEARDARPAMDLSQLDADGGVSIHVFASEGLDEYLRFDCFAKAPHYHYVCPGPSPHHVRVPYDQVANRDVLTWSLSVLRSRLGPLLGRVGASALLDDADAGDVEHVLGQVEELARRMATDGAEGADFRTLGGIG